jgi:UDP-N-acetylmuramate: L-alanyl-gamma-D-glutamyl-meso-diaminopimelate ligase
MVLLNADDPNCVEVGKSCPAPIVEVGFSPNAANHIRNQEQRGEMSSFELFGERFDVPLLGEFNIRNAAMAASAAHFYGIPTDVIRGALGAFSGIKRRQELRGEVRGIRIIDDFGHHPTAIRETLAGMRRRYAGSRIWAIFEPRSNTTRRAVFQHALPAAFEDADGVVIAQVARLEQIPEGERLDPERVVRDIASSGKPAFYEPTADAIVERLRPMATEGDVVVVFSNGGFDGIHDKLLGGL